MLLLKSGLKLAVVAALFAGVASVVLGYPTEMAILRALVVWGVIAFVAFIAELVVATTPVPPGSRLNPPPVDGVTDDDKAEAA